MKNAQRKNKNISNFQRKLIYLKVKPLYKTKDKILYGQIFIENLYKWIILSDVHENEIYTYF